MSGSWLKDLQGEASFHAECSHSSVHVGLLADSESSYSPSMKVSGNGILPSVHWNLNWVPFLFMYDNRSQRRLCWPDTSLDNVILSNFSLLLSLYFFSLCFTWSSVVSPLPFQPRTFYDMILWCDSMCIVIFIWDAGIVTTFWDEQCSFKQRWYKGINQYSKLHVWWKRRIFFKSL